MKLLIAAALAALSVTSQARADFILPTPDNQIEFGRNNSDFYTVDAQGNIGKNLHAGTENFGASVTDLPISLMSTVGVGSNAANESVYSSTATSFSFVINTPTFSDNTIFWDNRPRLMASISVQLSQSGDSLEQVGIYEENYYGGGGWSLFNLTCGIGSTAECGTYTFVLPIVYYPIDATQFGGTLNFIAYSTVYSGTGSAFGFVKPTLSLDSNFTARYPQFNVQILTDPVIGAPVPEPSTWTMMILGVAGIGATLRRRALARAA